MDIASKFENVSFNYVRKAGSAQVVVECDIDTTEKGGLSKILSIAGDARINKCEAMQKECRVSGRVNYKIIFVNNDGKLVSLDYFSDFSDTVADECIEPTMNVCGDIALVDIDSSVSGERIRLQAVCDVDLYGVASESCDCLTDAADCLTEIREQSVQHYVRQVKDGFDIQEDYETGCNVDKILIFDCTAVNTGVKCNENSFIIQGDVYAQIVYASEGKIVTKSFTLPYSEEISAQGASVSSRHDVRTVVKDSRIVLSGVEDNNVIRLEISVGVECAVFDNGSMQFVTDVFSPKYELKCESKTVTYKRYEGSVYANEKINGELTLDMDMKSVKKIVATCVARNSMTNLIAADGEVTVEGLLTACVIYQEEDDAYNSMQIELPYSLCLPSDAVKAGDSLRCAPIVGGIAGRVKRDREIEVVAEICVDCALYRDYDNNVITALETSGERNIPLKAMSVYAVGKGESLWDISKKCCMPKDMLTAQNPDIDFTDLRGGERVLVYRELKIGS